MTDQLWRLSAVETAALIKDGVTSSADVLEAHLDRLNQVNQRLNAVTNDLSDVARAAAKAADEKLAAGGELGPLHGVPITIKENVDQTGQSTPNGVTAFEAVVAEADSPIVVNLEAAGAVVLGRTNTPEFSFRWFTDNDLRGLTSNPWHEGITPGGSSGGAASSLAMGVGCIAHGNDLGGSLRYPAYCCGLSTIRPSLGRVAAYNPSGAEERPPSIQAMSVQGPIGRTVADVRLGLEAMAAPDWRDPWQAAAPLRGDDPGAPIRVAVSVDPVGLGVDPTVAAAIDFAAGTLSDAGYAVEEADPPAAAEIAEVWRRLLFTEAQVMMGAAMESYASDNFKQIFADCLAATTLLDLDGYMRAAADRTRLRRLWAGFMQDYPLVLMPVSAEPPMPQGEDLKGAERVKSILDAQAPLYVINYLGLPSAATPTGVIGDSPMGVQIVGQAFREDLCLDAAQAIENRVGILSEQLWSREN